MRVALLNPVYWPEVRRGSERFARELADHLIASGNSVRLLTSHPGRTSRTVEDGMEVVRSWRPPDGRLRRRLYEEHLTHLPLTFRELMRGDDEVAHALYPTDAVAAAEWRRRTGRPLVHSYMGIPHRRSLANRRGRVAIMQRALTGSDVTIALSEAAARGFRDWLGVETPVIAPGVDLEAFSPGGSRHERPTVLFTADTSQPRKRFELLLEAMAIVRRREPEVRLVANRPGDPGRTELLAHQGVDTVLLDDRSALVEQLRSAWVTCLPSTGEAFGLVLLESMACGTPVVGTDDGGIPEVIGRDGRAGLLFGGGAPELADALLDVLALAGRKRTAASARKRAELFPVSRTAGAYEALYRSLILGTVTRPGGRRNGPRNDG